MLNKYVFLVLLATALIGTSAAAEPRQPKVHTAYGIVFRLYRDYAWEAVMAGGSDGLMQQPPQILKQYFDENLTSLILRDRKCSAKGQICRLDFVPMWDSQDPAAVDLRVEKTVEKNVIKVSFRRPGTNENIMLTYRVRKTDKGWRISDIVGKEWSLLALLSESR